MQRHHHHQRSDKGTSSHSVLSVTCLHATPRQNAMMHKRVSRFSGSVTDVVTVSYRPTGHLLKAVTDSTGNQESAFAALMVGCRKFVGLRTLMWHKLQSEKPAPTFMWRKNMLD